MTVIPHPALTRRVHLEELIEETEAEVAFFYEKYCDLRDGTLRWPDWDPELTCPEPQQAAEDEVFAVYSEAKDRLRKLTEELGGAA